MNIDEYYDALEDKESLEHHGILGMKWGIRRYQNEDGSLTAAGRKRYSTGKHLEELNDKQIKSLNKRLAQDVEARRMAKERQDMDEQDKWEVENHKREVKQQKIDNKNRSREISLREDQQKFNERQYDDRRKDDAIRAKEQKKQKEEYAKNNSHRFVGKDITKLSDSDLKLLNDRLAAESNYRKAVAPKNDGKKGFFRKNAEDLANQTGKEVTSFASKALGGVAAKVATSYINKATGGKYGDVLNKILKKYVEGESKDKDKSDQNESKSESKQQTPKQSKTPSKPSPTSEPKVNANIDKGYEYASNFYTQDLGTFMYSGDVGRMRIDNYGSVSDYTDPAAVAAYNMYTYRKDR